MLKSAQSSTQAANIKAFFMFFIISFLLYSPMSYAIEIDLAKTDALTMLQNLSSNFPSLMRLVTAIAYVLGMSMVIKGVMTLREHAESRASRSDHHGLKSAIILMACGAALLYLPSSVQTGLSTFWTNPNPYAYETSVHDSWYDFMSSVFTIVQVIGTIAFIRGLIIMSHLGQQGGQQGGGFGKAMAHIVGGVLCINLYQVIQTILSTLAVGITL